MSRARDLLRIAAAGAVAVAMLVAVPPASRDASAAASPPGDGRREIERMAGVTDEQLALMVRVALPMPGEPPPTAAEREAADEGWRTLGGSYGVRTPLPDHELARRLAAVLLGPSADQWAAMEATILEATAEAERRYVGRLREAALAVHVIMRDEWRTVLAGRAPDPLASRRRAGDGRTAARRATLDFAAERQAAVQAVAGFLTDEQRAALPVVLASVRDDLHQRSLHAGEPDSEANPVERVVAFLEAEEHAGRVHDRAAVRAALEARVPARTAAIRAALDAEADASARGLERRGAMEAGELTETIDRAAEAADRRRTRAVRRLGEANALVVEAVASVLEPDAARRLRRAWWRRHVWTAMQVTHPAEWETARRLLVEADPPAEASRAVAEATLAVDAARDRLFAAYVARWREHRGGLDPHDAARGTVLRALARHHLAAERAALEAIDGVIAALSRSAGRRPDLEPLMARLGTLRDRAAGAVAEARRLADDGAAPWALGLAPFRPEGWTRPGDAAP